VLLINREFVIILSIAGVLGSVGGFYLTKMLLTEIYAYHIPVSLGPVLAGAIIIFTTGILTTTSAIFKAARANPVKSLRAD
jgi:ABC-type antimicrobial peptide transport system permease subunit